jgi:hypothetical protein
MPEWSPYTFEENNPINMVDPDGNMAVPFDWIKFQDGSLKFDASISNQAQATAKYGSGATDIGRSSLLTNQLGQTVSLNANGTATGAVPLNEVTVSAKASNGSALLQLGDAVGLSNDTHAGILAGVQMLDKGGAAEGFATVGKALDIVGKATGIVGAIGSGSEFINNPTTGNFLKMGTDIALVALKVNPVVAIADGVLSVTGVKDAAFKAIDNQIDTYRINNMQKAQSINPSIITIR